MTSAGADGITVHVMKYGIAYVSEPISSITNCSFRTGIFPDQ